MSVSIFNMEDNLRCWTRIKFGCEYHCYSRFTEDSMTLSSSMFLVIAYSWFDRSMFDQICLFLFNFNVKSALVGLFKSFLAEWFDGQYLSLFSFLMLTAFPLSPSHSHTLIIRGRLLIFVIHSGCRCPACTLALIEILQMKPSRLGLLCPQLLTQRYSRLSELSRQSREWQGGELFNSVKQMMFLRLCELVVKSVETCDTVRDELDWT